jgi:hypothetical protein
MATTFVSVPKYRHHKGSGQAFVQVRGKRHYLGPYSSPKSKERYSRFVAELAAQRTTTPIVTPTDRAGLTVVELAAAYLDFAEGYYRKNGAPTRTLDNIRTSRPNKLASQQ